ncbi:MAG TPA: hypothetical protein PLV41_04335 [Miltoncostaeales bacterium]|nr:hypothetical protein [Miltoncostaeales bacterium]
MIGAGRRLVIGVACAGIALVGLYVALGGGRFEPVRAADPCVSRQWRTPAGVQAVVEQLILSGLDGAACELNMSRESLALTLADEGEFRALSERKGIDDARLTEIFRVALRRAVIEGQRAGALTPLTVLVAGQAIDRLDLNRVLELYRSGQLDWVGAFVP